MAADEPEAAMAQAYSPDLRTRVIKAAAGGMQCEDGRQARQTWFDAQLDLDPES